MDDVEIHYNIISDSTRPIGRQMYATSACVALDLNTNDFVADIRHAWTAVRQKHPSIAVTIRNDKKQYTIMRDQGALDRWLEETVVVFPDQSSAELFPKLSSRMIEQSTLFVLPYTNEIMVRITHENADAEGVIRVLEALLQSLANPEENAYAFDGSEISRLSMPFAAGAPLPEHDHDGGAAFAQQALQDYAASTPGLGLQVKTTDKPPSDANRYDYAFSAEKSAQIIQASKARGLTPFHVLQTASMMATHRLSEVKSGKFATYGVFSVRKHCAEPVKSDPTSISIIGWPIVYRPPFDSFLDLAERVKAF